MRSILRDLATTARPAHWLKNVFILAPIVFAQQLGDWESVLRVLVLYVLFCIIASGVYFINDAADAHHDRRHPRKARRPVAAGRLPRKTAAAIGAVLAASAIGCSALLGPGVVATLGAYAGVNISYSLWLRRIWLVDSIAVATGFVLRTVAGAVAIAVPFSTWLAVCTLLLALLIAMGKRRAEFSQGMTTLVDTRPAAGLVSRKVTDTLIKLVAGVTVITYAVYILVPDTADRFGSHGLLLTGPFVVYGVTRFASRVLGSTDIEDPTTLFLHDRGLQLTVLAWVLVTLVTVY